MTLPPKKEPIMDFKLSDEDHAFRDSIRDTLEKLLPSDIRERQRLIRTEHPPLNDQRRWFKLLDGIGWSVPSWPEAFGGTGWTALQRFVFEDEIHKINGPEFHWIGSHMVGPVLCTFGTEDQQRRFLPRIRSGEDIWCQGFSEPGAGSDLANLRTNAVRHGDSYVLNGQKIWTSGAYEADWGFFLVKTEENLKPQASLSFLLVKMNSPGIVVRQIPEINGEAHLCEVFLDNVEVPAENLVGEPGKGWTYAKFLLEHERATSAFIFWSKREMARAYEIALRETRNGVPLSQIPAYSHRLARLEAELTALEWSVLRVLAQDASGIPIHVAASILKIRGSELQQAITELHVDLLGLASTRFFDPDEQISSPSEAWPEYVPGRTAIMMINRAATIYGGTKQIQKNIIAKSYFGL